MYFNYPNFYIFFMYEYLLLQIGIKDFWIQQVNLEFFITFSFQDFLGQK